MNLPDCFEFAPLVTYVFRNDLNNKKEIPGIEET